MDTGAANSLVGNRVGNPGARDWVASETRAEDPVLNLAHTWGALVRLLGFLFKPLQGALLASGSLVEAGLQVLQ